MTLEKGHNSTKRDNPDLKKNMGQLSFDEESIYEISKPYLKFVTDGRTDGRAQSNMPLQLFQSWGHSYMGLLRIFACKTAYRYILVLLT